MLLGLNKNRLNNTVQLLPDPSSDIKIFFNIKKKDLKIDFSNIILD